MVSFVCPRRTPNAFRLSVIIRLLLGRGGISVQDGVPPIDTFDVRPQIAIGVARPEIASGGKLFPASHRNLAVVCSRPDRSQCIRVTPSLVRIANRFADALNSVRDANPTILLHGAAPQCRAAPGARHARNRWPQRCDAAHGFGASMIAGLVNQGLATMTPSKVRAGGKVIEVAKVRITAAGREALADDS